MRVLAVMREWPYPLTNGVNLRAFHFLKGVSRQHEVVLVHFGPAGECLESLGVTLYSTVSVPRTAQPRKDGTLRRLGRAIRIGSVWPVDGAMLSAIDGLVKSFRPEAIWCTHLEMGLYAPKAMRRRVLVDVIDDQVLAYIGNRDLGPLRRLKQLLDWGLVEVRCGMRCAVATFASRKDARAFRRWCPWLRCLAVPNGVDTSYYSPHPSDEREAPYIVLVGNYQHPPNATAVQALLWDIWPLVKKEMPDLGCRLVGPNLPADLAAQAAAAGILVAGLVEDTRPHLAGAAVAVSPLVTGTGIKNKVLEAWAMGKAVVALPAGLAGLEQHAAEACILARDAKSFARALVDLVRNPIRRQSLGRAARALVERQYDWRIRAQDFARVLETLNEAHQ